MRRPLVTHPTKKYILFQELGCNFLAHSVTFTILLPASVILLPESVILMSEFLDSYLGTTSLIRKTLLVLVCNTIKSSNAILLQDRRLLMYMFALMYPDFLILICFSGLKYNNKIIIKTLKKKCAYNIF